MKMMIVLIAIVGLVGQSMAGAVPESVETLVRPHDEAPIHSTDELLEKLNKIDPHQSLGQIERDASISEYVASLLYAIVDKASTATYNDVTADKLIKLNTIQLGECNPKGFEKRINVVKSLRPENYALNGVSYAVNLYALRTLHLAAYHCLINKAAVIEEGISDEEFMTGLSTAQGDDGQRPAPVESEDEILVYNGFKSNVQSFVEKQLEKYLNGFNG